jgi:hypothetical protein
MNNCPGRGRGHRPPWLRQARVVVVIVATVGLALLAAACSASQSSSGSDGSPNAGASADAGGSANISSAVSYTNCMRSHGVPGYPDPSSTGQLPVIHNPQKVGVSYGVLTAAVTACQHLWPYQGLTQVQEQQELAVAVKFAGCMRSHGVPNWPDPTTDATSGRVEFVIGLSSGIDPYSSQIDAKAQVCERGVPAYMLPDNPDGVEVVQSS